LKVLQSTPPVKDDSKVDIRAQLQEAQLKLKAAEEEVVRLQAQQPQQDGGDTGSRCRIVEREANLCKGELRVVHSKVLTLLMLTLSPQTCPLQYSALQSVVSSFLEQGSASDSAHSSAEKVLSKEKEAAMSRLVDADARDEHSDSAASGAIKAPAKSEKAAPAFKHSKAGKSSTYLKASKRPLPEDADAELEEHSHQDRAPPS
jgi:hypothetical protein